MAVAAAFPVIAVVTVNGMDDGESTAGGPTGIQSTPPAPSPTAPTDLPPSTSAHKKLLKSVRSEFRDSCKPLAVTDSALRPKLVAALRCDPGSSGTPDDLDYLQYSTKSAMESAFERYVGGSESSCRVGWNWDDTPMKTQGKKACFQRQGVQLIVWDDVDLHILYRAGSESISGSDLNAWWLKRRTW